MSDLDVLKDFAGGFINFDANGLITGIFRGVTVEDNPFKKGDVGPSKRMVFHIEGPDGIERFFNSTSKRLAKAVLKSGVKDGDVFEIRRSGEGFQAEFEVKVITASENEKQETKPETEEDLGF